MRKTLLVVGVLSMVNFTFGQSFTQANEPTIGTSVPMFLVDSFATDYANVVGSNVTWDYSGVGVYPGEIRNIDVVDPATTTYGSQFPNATVAIEIQNLLVSYMSSDVNQRVSHGFVFSEPSFGDVIAKWSTDNAILANYPYANGNNLTDAYSGDLQFDFNGLPMNPSAAGVIYTAVDGQGTMLFANGVSVSNVIRYSLVDTTMANVQFFGDIELVRKQYEYYDLASMSTPIFVHSTLTIQPPGGAPIAENTLVLSYYNGYAVGIEEHTASQVTLYPNPSNGLLTVSGVENNSKINVINTLGQVVYSNEINKQETLDLNFLSRGVYMISIENETSTITKQFVIK